MALFGQSGCIRAKVVVFEKKMVVFGQKWLFSGKVDLLRLYSCIGAKVVVFGQSGFISTK